MLAKLWRAVADLLFPRCCEVCGKELMLYEKFLCRECLAQMPFTYFWQIEENPALRTFWGRAKIEGACSLFYYTDSYKKLIHSLKYRSNIKIGLRMGEELGSRIPFSVDYIVPIPLHWRKRLKRGYNQSQIIARGIQRGITNSLPDSYKEGPQVLNGLVKRRSFTSTQTQKDRQHRWENVSRAFQIGRYAKAKYDLNGKRILIVDDVLTSGATMDACANLLHAHYDCKIYVATLAYVE
jgi:ComF family protein